MTLGVAPPPLVEVPPGRHFWRVHTKGEEVLWFGPRPGSGPRNRFDAPGGQYGICYLGDSPEVSVAETVIRQPVDRFVPRARLGERYIARVPIVRNLRLVHFHGFGLLRIGIGADVAHGHPYDRCQALALSCWNHSAEVDGLEYRSRWDSDRLCFAVFDRARDALGAPDHHLNLAHPRIFGPIFRLYEIGVI